MLDQGSAEEAVATESKPLLDDNAVNSQREVDGGKDASTDHTLENKDKRADGGSGPLLSEASLEHENEMLPHFRHTAAVRSMPAVKSGGDETICEEHLSAFQRASSPCSPRGLGIEDVTLAGWIGGDAEVETGRSEARRGGAKPGRSGDEV